MRKEDIKWIAIQPLTGGMYLGAEEAIGHPAEFILSFEGLNYGNINENLEYDQAGNELYLQRYLEKKNRNVTRYDIQEAMFDPKLLETLKPTIFVDGSEVDLTEEYKDIDLVVAVPVCSGLSMATRASQETKDVRNCNMKFITKYTLSVIKPKVYVFENAPNLMSATGKPLVEYFKDLAKEFGYSVLFYRTDTNLHHNCQKRVRTFVAFFKHTSGNENELPFLFKFEDCKIPVKEYFEQMEPSELNNTPIETSAHNWSIIDYAKLTYGENWRDTMGKYVSIMGRLIVDNKLEDFRKYVADNVEDNEKQLKYIDHVIYKKSLDKNYFQDDVCYFTKHFPAVQFRSLSVMLHPTEDRMCTVREALALMGHPADFEWLTGTAKAHLPKIGQNVPVKTAKFIVENCVNALENWDTIRTGESNSMFQDNTKQITRHV